MARFKEPRLGVGSAENPVTVTLEDSDGSVSRYSFTAVGGDATVQFVGGSDLSTSVGSAISVTSGSTVTGPSSDLSGTGRLGVKVTFDATGFRSSSYLDVDVETVTDAELELEPWVPTLAAADGDLFASDGAGGVKAVSSGTYGRASLFARKTADESVTSSTTEQDDDELSVALEANKTYEISGILIYDGDSSGDLKVRFGGPTGASAKIGWTATGVAGTEASGAFYPYREIGWDARFGCAGVGTKLHASFYGIVTTGSTAGDLIIKWAQNVSNATATTIYTGSSVVVRPLS